LGLTPPPENHAKYITAPRRYKYLQYYKQLEAVTNYSRSAIFC
jgi:hypothetical protein